MRLPSFHVLVLFVYATLDFAAAVNLATLSDAQPSSMKFGKGRKARAHLAPAVPKAVPEAASHAPEQFHTAVPEALAKPIGSMGVCNWRTFGNGSLVRTARNKYANHRVNVGSYSPHPSHIVDLFIYPPAGFAFCPIEKNAVSGWSTVFSKILEEEAGPRYEADKEHYHKLFPNHPNYHSGQASQFVYGRAGMEEVFANPRGVRAVFVREPLARFASAFMDKCARPTERNTVHCPTHTNIFKDAVEWALRTDMSVVNPHWLPQAYHCELHKYISAYTVIGVIDKTNNVNQYPRDAACLLEEAGLSRFDIFSNQTDVGERPHCPTCAATSMSASEEDILKRLFTPDAARALIKRLQIDYDTFGFVKEPAWVAAATGEWYSKPPNQLGNGTASLYSY